MAFGDTQVMARQCLVGTATLCLQARCQRRPTGRSVKNVHLHAKVQFRAGQPETPRSPRFVPSAFPKSSRDRLRFDRFQVDGTDCGRSFEGEDLSRAVWRGREGGAEVLKDFADGEPAGQCG